MWFIGGAGYDVIGGYVYLFSGQLSSHDRFKYDENVGTLLNISIFKKQFFALPPDHPTPAGLVVVIGPIVLKL